MLLCEGCGCNVGVAGESVDPGVVMAVNRHTGERKYFCSDECLAAAPVEAG